MHGENYKINLRLVIMSSKSISRSVIWQFAGKLSLQGLAFFTAPVFTRLLSPSDYGYVSLYTSWCSIVGIFVAMEVVGSIGNARIKYDGMDVYAYLSSILTLTLIPFALFLCGALLFNAWLAPLMGLRRDLVILVVLNAYATFLTNLMTAKLDTYKQVEKSALLSFFQGFVIFAVSLFFVIRSRNDRAVIKIYSQAIPTILIGLTVCVVVYIKGKCFWKWEYNRFCLTLTLPLLGHSIGGLIFAQCDRLMLHQMQNESQLGMYSIIYTLCGILMTIYSAFNIAWVPFYYDFKKQKKEQEIISHTKRYIKFFTLVCVGFLLLAEDVFKLLAPELYWQGINSIPIFVLSFYFNYLYLFPVNFEFYHHCTGFIPVATIISAVTNVIMNMLLIPRFSMYGAAVGSLISHVFLFCIHEIFAKFFVKKNYEYNLKIFIPGVVVLMLFAIFFYLLKDFFALRCSLAVLTGGYLIAEIIRNKAIF